MAKDYQPNTNGWNWDNVTDELWNKVDEEMFGFIQYCKQKNYKTLLDIGAGKGRHAIMFAQKGFCVSALDISPTSINSLKENSQKYQVPFSILYHDMHNLDNLHRIFDVIIAINSIYHTNEEGMHRIIDGIQCCLAPNGIGHITFLSDEDRSYRGQKVAKKEDADGSTLDHIYMSENDIRSYLGVFDILAINKKQYGDKKNPNVHYSVYIHKK